MLPAFVPQEQRLSSIAAKRQAMLGMLYRQSQPYRLLYWPIYVALGIILWSQLPSLQQWGVILPCIALLLVLWMVAQRAAWRLLPAILAVLMGCVLGIAAMQLRVEMLAAPKLSVAMEQVTLRGIVVNSEFVRRGPRLKIMPLEIAELPAAQLPKYVRLQLSKNSEMPAIGDEIRVTANLRPPSPPLAPGDFDGEFYFYFEQIGALGHVPRLYSMEQQTSSNSSNMAAIRQFLSEAVREKLTGDQAALVIALLTGSQGAISKDAEDAMRSAGLTHLLAISGLNIALAAAIALVGLRYFLVLLALRWQAIRAKEMAAALAMLIVTGYTFLVAAPLSAQRAWLMSLVMLAAILLRRKAFSPQLVAVAALIILLSQPEALFNAGFQLSFAAVIALLLAEHAHVPRRILEQYSWLYALRYPGLLLLTAFFASLATMPLIAYHFQQFSWVGVLANVVAVPWTSFVIMPLVVLAYPLIWLGLDGYLLAVLGWAAGQLLVMAEFFSAWQGPVWLVPQLAPAALLGLALAVLAAILWRGRVKLFALVPLFLAGLAQILYSPPSLLLDDSSGQMQIYQQQLPPILSPNAGRFIRSVWARRYGGDPVDCTEICRVAIGQQEYLVPLSAAAVADYCGMGVMVLRDCSWQQLCPSAKHICPDGSGVRAWWGNGEYWDNQLANQRYPWAGAQPMAATDQE